MKYLMVNKPRLKIVPVDNNSLKEAFRNLSIRGYNPREVAKPPSKRTIRRWRKQGKCRALCGCFIPCVSGERCYNHNEMSWLTALNIKVYLYD